MGRIAGGAGNISTVREKATATASPSDQRKNPEGVARVLLGRAGKDQRVALRAMFSYYCNLEKRGRAPGLSERKVRTFAKDFDIFPRLCTASMIKRLWSEAAGTDGNTASDFIRFVIFLVSVSWDAFNKPFLARPTPDATFSSLMDWLMASPKLNEISRHEWMSGRTKRGSSISSITAPERSRASSSRSASPQFPVTLAEGDDLPEFLLATDNPSRRRKMTWGSPFGGKLVERGSVRRESNIDGRAFSPTEDRKKSLAFGNFAVTGHLGKRSNKCQAAFALNLRGGSESRNGRNNRAGKGKPYKAPWGMQRHVDRIVGARHHDEECRDKTEFRRNITSPAACNVRTSKSSASPTAARSPHRSRKSQEKIMRRSPVPASSRRSPTSVPAQSVLQKLATTDLDTEEGAELLNSLDASISHSPGRRIGRNRRKSVEFGNFATTGHLGSAGGNKSQATFALKLRDGRNARSSQMNAEAFVMSAEADVRDAVSRIVAKGAKAKPISQELKGSLEDIIASNPHLSSSCLSADTIMKLL